MLKLGLGQLLGKLTEGSVLTDPSLLGSDHRLRGQSAEVAVF